MVAIVVGRVVNGLTLQHEIYFIFGMTTILKSKQTKYQYLDSTLETMRD